jgi:hypothetical protein
MPPRYIAARGGPHAEQAHWALPGGAWVPNPHLRHPWAGPGAVGLPPGSARPLHVAAHRVYAHSPQGQGYWHTEREHWARPGGGWIANPNLPAPHPAAAAAAAAQMAAQAPAGLGPPGPPPPLNLGPLAGVEVVAPPRRVKRAGKRLRGRR